MVSDRLFDIEEVPEVPLFRERRRVKAARGVALDSRFSNEYPPEWSRCRTCGGRGKSWGELQRMTATISSGEEVLLVWKLGDVEFVREGVDTYPDDMGEYVGFRRRDAVCPDCLGMGSLKARVRLEAGHRCVRCMHPYMPKGDARILGVERSGMHECPDCEGWGRITDPDAPSSRCKCDGRGVVWTPWSSCDERCTHAGPICWRPVGGEEEWAEAVNSPSTAGEWITDPDGVQIEVEAEWRILTVHHLDGDKANVRWWNLAALCQRCHLEIQSRVVMERVYPHEHSEWFKPYVSGYYAAVYLNEADLSREEVMGRLDELLALERQA